MSAVPQFLKRVEARIALALAEVRSALAGIASLSNHVQDLLPAPIGPANVVTFTHPGFVPRSGKVRVFAVATIFPNGGTVVAGDPIDMTILRDGVPVPGAADVTSVMAPSGGVLTLALNLVADDSVVPGSTHAYALQAHCGNAHTISLSGNETVLILQELPA